MHGRKTRQGPLDLRPICQMIYFNTTEFRQTLQLPADNLFVSGCVTDRHAVIWSFEAYLGALVSRTSQDRKSALATYKPQFSGGWGIGGQIGEHECLHAHGLDSLEHLVNELPAI